MSYIKPLDEYDESELLLELELRKMRRDSGVCDYCGRPPTDEGKGDHCKFPHRHFRGLRNFIAALEDMLDANK